MRTAFMIAIIVLADSAGDVFLTKGMKQVGEISTWRPGELFSIARKVIANGNFLTSLFFMTATFFSFLAVLSWADLSLVFPATCLVYVVSTVGARFFLNETVSVQRWAGTLLVCAGVALVSLP